MKCTDIMNKNLEWLTEKDTIFKAATVMAEAGIGFLPICDAHMHVVGVVTDRDLTTARACQAPGAGDDVGGDGDVVAGGHLPGRGGRS
jgi:CBS domain-containing protein